MDSENTSTPGGEGSAGSAASPEPPKKHYAHRRIEHDGEIIEANGEPLPNDFPEESLARLIKNKAVGDVPPAGPTEVTHAKRETKGEPK